MTTRYNNCFDYAIMVILRFSYRFFSGYNKNTMLGRFFFFFGVWVFLWGLGMVIDFITHFLILIVKVHKMSWAGHDLGLRLGPNLVGLNGARLGWVQVPKKIFI